MPLITRELEAGTHRLAWNQSVTRGRWLAAKLGLVGLLSVAAAGLYSLLLTWAASPIDLVNDNRFTPLLFDDRNIVPLAYAAFAFVLGLTFGLFIRRTVPAMAAALVVFAVVQMAGHAHHGPAESTSRRSARTVPLTASEVSKLSFFGEYGTVGGVSVAGGPWIVSTSAVLDSSGHDVGYTSWWSYCVNVASPASLPNCIAKENVHVEVSSQPASRYWSFQWYETGIFAAVSALLAGLCFWRIRSRLS